MKGIVKVGGRTTASGPPENIELEALVADGIFPAPVFAVAASFCKGKSRKDINYSALDRYTP